MSICGKSTQARILNRPPGREVVKTLELVVPQTKDVMEGVVEIAAYSGTAHSSSLSFEVQHLPQHTGLPEKPSIPPGARGEKTLPEVRDHAQAKGSRSGNPLPATDNLSLLTEVSGNETE